MKEYSTSQIAKEANIHHNTVRFYEEIGFLPTIPRKANGYRVYNEVHLEQLKLIRLGLKSELLQNGLRTQITNIIKTSAMGEYDKALELARRYMVNVEKEEVNARESIEIVEEKILNDKSEDLKTYTRKQLADHMGLTIDTLRNWELNGLLKIKRRKNGYRIYNQEDIKRIKIIRALRCASFSLSAILRLLQDLDINKNTDVKAVIDTPGDNEDIVSACDKLLTSLSNAKIESENLIKQINKIKQINSTV